MGEAVEGERSSEWLETLVEDALDDWDAWEEVRSRRRRLFSRGAAMVTS